MKFLSNLKSKLMDKLLKKILTPIITRWMMKTPIVYRIISVIAFMIIGLYALPGILNTLCDSASFLCFDIPQAVEKTYSKIVAVTGLVVVALVEYKILPEDAKKKIDEAKKGNPYIDENQ